MQQPRQMYGLGSLVKSITKGVKTGIRGITDTVKENPMLALAALNFSPMLTGGNPFIGMGSGKFAGSLANIPKIGGITEALGLNVATGEKPTIGQIGKVFTLGALGTLALDALSASGADEEDLKNIRDVETLETYLANGYKQLNPEALESEVDSFVKSQTKEYRAEGGRIGYEGGGPTKDQYGIMTLPESPSNPDSFNDDIDRVAQLVAQSSNLDKESQMNNKQIAYDRIEKIAEEMSYDGNIEGVRSNLISYFDDKVQEYMNMIRENKAMGGRMGYSDGTDFEKYLKGREEFDKKQNIEQLYKEYLENKRRLEVAEQKTMAANGGRMGYNQGTSEMGIMASAPDAMDERNQVMEAIAMKQFGKPLSELSDEEIIQIEMMIDEMVKTKDSQRNMAAFGGRMGYAMGSEENRGQQNAMAASLIEGIPLNQNPAGITELDLRETGGFIPPVGVKEKADDIPAMVSNNEFVMTADAVKGMGDGDVNKGAQRMYDMMKKLEGGGLV